MSVESYGFKFVVDAKDAAKGYGDFQRAVDGVFNSLARFEQQAKKSLDSVTANSRKGQSDIAKYAAQFKNLSNIPIDGRAAPQLLKLSDAMARFKAPNTTQISNMRNFFRTLGTLPDLGGTTRSIGNIAKLSAAMNGFKAPSAAQAEKLVLFAKAMEKIGPGLSSLSRVSGVSGIANELASVSLALRNVKIPSASQAANLQNFARALQSMRIGGQGNLPAMLQSLSHMNGFKAPSAAQTRNLQQFVAAVNNLKVPPNASAISAHLQSIATAANAANGSLKNFRGSLNGMNWGGFNNGVHKARIEMMGLQNAFSGTFQVGSLLRSLLGSLTIGELGRAFFNATQSANQFHASMEVLGQSPMMQSAEWDRVRNDANKFGQDLLTFSDGFSKFAVAAHESGMSLSESFKVWEGFSTVSSAMHLGQEQQQSVGLAIREIMDQGYVSTSRLTRQLGLVLPGAMATLQKAWKESGKKGVSFFDALKKKMVDGQWALDTLADHYKTTYGVALKAALESPIQQFNILKNNINELMIQIGNDGAKKAFSDFIAKLSGGLDPSHMKAFAQGISDGLVKALRRAGEAVDWLKANWDSLKGPLATALSLMGKWMVISAAFKIGSAFVSPLLNARRALVSFNGTMLGTSGTLGRLQSGFNKLTTGVQPLPVSLGRSTMGIRAMQIAANSGTVAVNGLKMAGTGLLDLLGGPLGIALSAIGLAFAATASHIMSQKIATNDLKASIDDTMTTLHDQTAALHDNADQAVNAANAVHGAGSAAHDAKAGIDMCAVSAQNAADKFFNLAMQARTAMIAMNNQKINDLQNQKHDAILNTKAGADYDFDSKKSALLGGGGRGFSSIKDYVTSDFRAIGADLGHTYDNGEGDRAALAQANRVDGAIAELKKRNDFIWNQATGKQVIAMNGGANQLPDTPTPTDPIYHGDGDGSGKKKKKGPDPEKQFKSMENDISSMMDKLLEGDPMTKLYADFVNTLTKEGQTLLNNKAYHTFIDNMKTDAKTGKVSVDALIEALQNGGIKGKALDDLKKRYHTDVKGIITMLRSQQTDYENAVKDATEKRIDDQFKTVNDAMKRLAEDDPVLKVQQEFFDDLKSEAKDLLGSDAFTSFMDNLATHTYTAAEAGQLLIDKLKGVNNLAPGLADHLRMVGGSTASLQDHVARTTTVEGYNSRKATRDQQFGGANIDEMKQQLNLLTLNDKQQEIANKLLEAYNQQMALKGYVTQKEIDTYQTQLSFWQAQIDHMQKMKEYYQNNGIKSYIKDIQTAGDFVHNFDANILHNMEDTLYKLGTTGKLSFKGLLDGMQSDIIRFSSQQLTSKLVSFLKPNAMNQKDPTFGGMIGKMLGGTTGFTDKPLGSDEFSPMFVSVVNGGLGLSFGAGAGGNGMLPGIGSGTAVGGTGFAGLDGIGGLFGNSASDLTDPTKAGSPAYVMKDATANAMTAVQPQIQQSFGQTFKGLSGSLGAMLGGVLGNKLGGSTGGGIGAIAGAFLPKLLGMVMGGGGAPMGGDLSDPLQDDFFFGDGYKEGGMVGAAVSRYRVSASSFANAPHYAEGTPNTSGGHPAILHDNEAVIPLSRGRKIPVDLTGVSSSANGGTVVNNNFNITSPDADSFRKSKAQIATELHAAGARSWSRDNV